MKELKRKTYLTIFAMLSLILLTVFLFINIRSYSIEKREADRILNFLDDRGSEGQMFGVRPETGPPDIENMMVMDHELYTALVEAGEVTAVFDHGNTSEGFDAESIAKQIVSSEDGDRRFIGNLFFAKYSFRYRYNDSITILNNADITQKLWELLIESILLFVILELVIAFITKVITNWITRPALDAFTRQKEFIADASHELKTPLAVIMASADEMTVEEKDKQNLENIRYESDRMSRLIGSLLNLSRLESGADKAGHKDENLSRILEKTCLSYEGVAYERGVLIETDIDEGINFICNKEEIEQMASTILDNSVRHSYKDTAVKVSARRKGKTGIVIKFINSGDPIPPDETVKIFERFYRSDQSRSRDDNRYGLGLAIAKRIAVNHGGDIKASSEDGKTEFRITFK